MSTTIIDWENEVPESLEFNYVAGSEVVAYDPDNDEEVRFDKRELLAGQYEVSDE